MSEDVVVSDEEAARSSQLDSAIRELFERYQEFVDRVNADAPNSVQITKWTFPEFKLRWEAADDRTRSQMVNLYAQTAFETVVTMNATFRNILEALQLRMSGPSR